jgi:hypothetical protein
MGRGMTKKEGGNSKRVEDIVLLFEKMNMYYSLRREFRVLKEES